jgi:hypothetical protein
MGNKWGVRDPVANVARLGEAHPGCLTRNLSDPRARPSFLPGLRRYLYHLSRMGSYHGQ